MAFSADLRLVEPEPSPVGQLTNAGRWVRWYLRCALLVDFSVALVAALMALIIRFGDILPYSNGYALITVALPFAWVGSLVLAGAHETQLLGIGSEEFRRIGNAGMGLTAAVAIVSYTAHIELARGYVFLALPLATVMGIGGRYALRKRLHHLRRNGRCMHRTVLVGHERAVLELGAQLRRERHHGIDIAGVCLPPGRPLPPRLGGAPVLDDFSRVSLAVQAAQADTVTVLACPEMTGAVLRRLAWQLEKTGTELLVAPGLVDVAGPRTTIRPIAGLPLLHVEHPELTGVPRVLKDVADRIGAGLALVLLSPLLAALALAIRKTSPGPALFRQTRIGKDGNQFTLVKFRTMRTDAEAHKARLIQQNEHDGVLFKIRDDPRVTKLGRVLRRYSLDELPQLINIARGQMSFVGPRPPLPEEVAEYGRDVRRRLVVKPGLTGLWQISGRSDLSWEESVRLDLRYVENWSLALDAMILWKTLSAVISGSGAY